MNFASVETIDNMLNFSDHLRLQLDISVPLQSFMHANVTKCRTCTVHSDPNNRGVNNSLSNCMDTSKHQSPIGAALLIEHFALTMVKLDCIIVAVESYCSPFLIISMKF